MKTKPTQETGLSEEGIGEAIKEGAITKLFGRSEDNRERVKPLTLNRDHELPAIQTTRVYGGLAPIPGLKTEFEAHALQELQHADTLANRIQQLGGVPVFNLQELAGKAASIGVHLSKERRSSKWWAKISCSNADKWRRTARSFERLGTRIWSPDKCCSTSCKRRSSMPAS